MPVQTLLVVPFTLLGELVSHEEQLLAGQAVLVPVQQSQTGKLLPGIAGHLVQKGALEMDDFVMGQRQEKILGEGVHHPKREFVLEVAALVKWLGKVLQRVVHPAHVPLEVEAEASFADWTGDLGPGSGLLGDGQDAWVAAMDIIVQLPKESQGIDIFLTAASVGEPFAPLA